MRKDHELKEEFKKNIDFEKILSLMNNTLCEAEDELIETVPERFPTIHILGAPRSGTTLAVQVMAEKLDIGYINNLIAAFWKAPLFGVALSDQLLNSEYQSSYSSTFGRTDRIQEPHEFGYFWNYHLKYDDFQQKDAGHADTIDWDYLSNILKNMCRAFDKPVLFKSFLFAFHSAQAVKHLNKTCFVYIRRNLIDNAMSLLKMRRDYFGDVEKWASIKPKNYELLKHQNRYVQVMGQVLFLEHEYLKQLKQIPEENRLIIDYDNLCRQTNDVLNEVSSMIGHHCKKPVLADFDKTNRLKVNRYDRNSPGIKKLRRAKQFLLTEFEELNYLIENRNQNFIN